MNEEYNIGDVVKYLNKISKKKKKGKLVEKSPLSDLFGSSSCHLNNTDFYGQYLKNAQSGKSLDVTESKRNSAEKKERSKKGQKEKESDSKKDEEEGDVASQETETSPSVKDAEQHKEEGKQSQPDATKDSRTIFVGNVPKKVEKRTLEKFFQEYGLIESIRVRSLAPSQQGISQQVVGKTKDINDRRTNYNAYIVFEKEESAKNALEKNGEILEGHHLRVDLTLNDRKKVDSKLSVFVGSLPYDVREEDVREHFEDFGDLESVRLIQDSETGMGKGFGFLVFKDQSSVALALKMKEHRIQGRRIRVKAVENVKKPKIPKSPHQNKESSKPQRRLNPKTLKRIRHKKKLAMKKSGEATTEGKSTKKHMKFKSDKTIAEKPQSNTQYKHNFGQKKKFRMSDKRNFDERSQDVRRKKKTVKRKYAGNTQVKGIPAPAGKKIKFD